MSDSNLDTSFYLGHDGKRGNIEENGSTENGERVEDTLEHDEKVYNAHKDFPDGESKTDKKENGSDEDWELCQQVARFRDIITVIKHKMFGYEDTMEKLLVKTDEYVKQYHNGEWSNKKKALLKKVIFTLVEGQPAAHRVFWNTKCKRPKINGITEGKWQEK